MMKLRSNRPGRDTSDIRGLVLQIGFSQIEEIENLYEAYYPSEVIPERALAMVRNMLVEIDAKPPKRPKPPVFNQI